MIKNAEDMRKLIFLILLFIGGIHSLSAQSCNPFFPFEEGKVIRYEHFDGLGKLLNQSEHRVGAISNLNTPNGEVLGANVEMLIMDQEGDSLLSHSYQIICKEEVLFVDVTDLLGPQLTASFLHMDLDIKGDALLLPKELKVGSKLPNAQTFIEGSAKGVNVLSMEFEVSNRKVAGFEQLKIGQASFPAYRITYDMEVNMMVKKTFRVVQWFTVKENIGLIRTEIYNQSQKLEGFSQLAGT